MSPKKTYVAVYERDPDDDAWLVSIKGIEGYQTYGRSLRQAEHRIRAALALWLDQDPRRDLHHERISEATRIDREHGSSSAGRRRASWNQSPTDDRRRRSTAH